MHGKRQVHIWEWPWAKDLDRSPSGRMGINLTKLMIEKIESEQGRSIYPRRMAIVEPVFANLRIHKRLDRFTLRGKIKVNIQWMLYCMVHNIEKIAHARAA